MNAYGIWVLITLAVFAFIAPSIVALAREVPNRASVIVVNLLFGLSVIGWGVALAMAVRSKPKVSPPAGTSPPPLPPGYRYDGNGPPRPGFTPVTRDDGPRLGHGFTP
jgi:hypothetical protein